MDWEMLGKSANLFGITYGSDQDSVKLDDQVWTFECDPDDGYRSYCTGVQLESKDIGPFLSTPAAIVTVREWTDRPEYADSAPDGFQLVDSDGHVWLTVGTNNSDDYYPSYTFNYAPKEAH